MEKEEGEHWQCAALLVNAKIEAPPTMFSECEAKLGWKILVWNQGLRYLLFGKDRERNLRVWPPCSMEVKFDNDERGLFELVILRVRANVSISI